LCLGREKKCKHRKVSFILDIYKKGNKIYHINYWHRIVSLTNYSQQNAKFLEFICFYKRSTCFRRFLRPSSRAHNSIYSFMYCQPILLLAALVEKILHGSSYQQYWLTIHEAVCTVMCSWWWAEEPPETCRASVKIISFKKCCILLTVILNYITMQGHIEYRVYHSYELGIT